MEGLKPNVMFSFGARGYVKPYGYTKFPSPLDVAIPSAGQRSCSSFNVSSLVRLHMLGANHALSTQWLTVLLFDVFRF